MKRLLAVLLILYAAAACSGARPPPTTALPEPAHQTAPSPPVEPAPPPTEEPEPIATPPPAEKPREHPAWPIVGTGLILMDCHQTMQIAGHPETYTEVGPAAAIIGAHPSKEAVLLGCTGWLATVHVLDYFLNEKWSRILWGGVIIGHGHAVANNWSIGLKFNF